MHNPGLRTGKSFHERLDEGHHKDHSHFCDLPIDMINNYSVDYIDSVGLGITKRSLRFWTTSDGVPKAVRMSSLQVAEVSSRLIEIGPFMPKVFAR